MGLENIRPENRIQVLTGIKHAKENAVGRKWKIGQTIGFSDEPIAHAIKEINGDMAVVWIPGDRNSIKTVNLSEIYDPSDAYNEALIEDAKLRNSANN